MSDEKEAKKEEKLTLPKQEEEVLASWKAMGLFEQTLQQSEGKPPYVFYDGPPFATGVPHYGHILQGTIKDVIPRYQTMRERYVRRVWGWDCHGLPIENLVEGELGLKHKKDIENYGVQNFNEKARGSVMRYEKEWKEIIPRTGRFVDMEHPYSTMDASYTESVWWAFKTLYDKGLIYEGYKSMHICPRCETTLAASEVTLAYKDVKDISVYVKFELKEEPETFLLAWTTTPWTLPGNVALAVGKDIEYVKVRHYSKEQDVYENVILAKDIFEKIKQSPTSSPLGLAMNFLFDVEGSEVPSVVATYKGKDLIGKAYTPVFDSFIKDASLKNHKNGWKVYAGEFVTTDSGTGIVHIAPAFGEDDMALGEKEQLPFIQHVNMDGTVVASLSELAGLEVKPKGDDKVRLSTDIAVLKYLQEKGVFFAKENITHSYPHCWRCDTPLLNYAAGSWFVKVTAIKDKLIDENKKITWVPAHIGSGRFGNWLEGARDWAISRTRYWGAPIPVWRCTTCKDTTIVGSLSELRANVSHRNTYTLMRHGQAESNATNIISGKKDDPQKLTTLGIQEVLSSAKELSQKSIDIIYASPFLRTQETAKLVAETISYDTKKIIFDDRLSEINPGIFDQKPIAQYRAQFSDLGEKFTKRPKGGENLGDVRQRVMEFLDEIDRTHEGKHILIVTHEYDIWMLTSTAAGLSIKESIGEKERRGDDFIHTAGIEELHYAPIPHNDTWELDYHRPYIDHVKLHCHCGGDMERIPEVFDCWFESGSMPYAQFHYLGNQSTEAGRNFVNNFPADFVAEAVDQTRGWFYNMLVLSVGLFEKSAYKNVICTGLILAEDGQKMSKKLKNYPDPMAVIEKYGADALRLYLLSSPVVRGENLSFSEAGINEVYKKIIMRLDNVRAFLKLYATEHVEISIPKNPSVLDEWILARLFQLEQGVSHGLESYELDVAVRPIPEFVDDLSTWYLRRSRERFKGNDEEDQERVFQTLSYVLRETAKIIAPIMPFYAETLYQGVRMDGPESVHLCEWPKALDPNIEIVLKMSVTRQIVSSALEKRAGAGIKVRQPLAELRYNFENKEDSYLSDEYHKIIAEEVNVKQVICGPVDEDENLKDGLSISLDTTITPELKQEGDARDIVRAAQELRKTAGLVPKEAIALSLEGATDTLLAFVTPLLKKDVHVKTITTTVVKNSLATSSLTIGDLTLTISISRI